MKRVGGAEGKIVVARRERGTETASSSSSTEKERMMERVLASARAMVELDIRTGRQVISAGTALITLCWYYVSGVHHLVDAAIGATSSTDSSLSVI